MPDTHVPEPYKLKGHYHDGVSVLRMVHQPKKYLVSGGPVVVFLLIDEIEGDKLCSNKQGVSLWHVINCPFVYMTNLNSTELSVDTEWTIGNRTRDRPSVEAFVSLQTSVIYE